MTVDGWAISGIFDACVGIWGEDSSAAENL